MFSFRSVESHKNDTELIQCLCDRWSRPNSLVKDPVKFSILKRTISECTENIEDAKGNSEIVNTLSKNAPLL